MGLIRKGLLLIILIASVFAYVNAQAPCPPQCPPALTGDFIQNITRVCGDQHLNLTIHGQTDFQTHSLDHETIINGTIGHLTHIPVHFTFESSDTSTHLATLDVIHGTPYGNRALRSIRNTSQLDTDTAGHLVLRYDTPEDDSYWANFTITNSTGGACSAEWNFTISRSPYSDEVANIANIMMITFFVIGGAFILFGFRGLNNE